jgi:hypothetical protein
MGVPTGCFPFGFSYQNCTSRISPLNDSLPHQFYSAFTRISKLLIMQLSPFLILSPNILYTLFSKTFSLRSFNWITDEVGPYLTTTNNLRYYRFDGTRCLLTCFIAGYCRCFAAYIPRAHARTGIPYQDHT